MRFIIPGRPNFYSGAPLDRQDHRRNDRAWIEGCFQNRATKVLVLWRSRHLVENDRPCWINRDQATALFSAGHETVFLGLERAAPRLAIDLSEVPEDSLGQKIAPKDSFKDLREIGPLLPQAEGATLAYARGLLIWHQRHRFCGVCGSPTRSDRAGHMRRCTNDSCAAPHFPRTDPAVIMLVHDGKGSCVLGRQQQWPPGMHSTLAGFVEPGETLEEAVAREVYEEVGLKMPLDQITYHSSQPWPFPSSIMLGFYGLAPRESLRICAEELAEANWYSKDDLRNSPENEVFRLPRRDSIARRLIEDWLALDP